MALVLRENDVARVLTMDVTLHAVERCLREQVVGSAGNVPRRRAWAPRVGLNVMSAAYPVGGYVGLKAYTVARGAVRFLVLLWNAETGQLEAIIEADKVGQMRTGAASGVATRHLARSDAHVLAVFGAGWQAHAQLEAVLATRPVDQVRVYSRSEDRRRQFVERYRGMEGVAVREAGTPEDALDGADIVVTITTSREPVFRGELLAPGAHVNAAGNNSLVKREIDEETVRRAALITTDSLEQARIECGDLFPVVERGLLRWEQVVELGWVAAGQHHGRQRDDDVTLFESQGIALEDVAVGAEVLRLARELELGEEIALF